MVESLNRRSFALTTSHQLAPVVVPYILLALASFTIILRFCARRLRKLRPGIDDWLCLVALMITWPYQACNTYAMTQGAGVTMQVVLVTDPMAFSHMVKAIFASNILRNITVAILQLSVLLFYVRIFGIHKWLRFSAYFLMVVISMFEISALVAQFLTCRPLAKFFNQTLQGQCFDQVAFCAATGLIHVVLDLAVIFLPLPLIWTLQTSVNNKILLTIVLGIGLFASITSLLKLTCLINFTFLNYSDISGSIWFSVLMQAIEIPLGIICTCIPSLTPVWVACKESRIGTSARRLLSTLRSGSMGGGSGGASSGRRNASSDSALSQRRGFTTGPSANFHSNFQRFDGSYATSNVETLHKPHSVSEDDVPLTVLPDVVTKPNSIQIQQSWKVDR